MISADGGPSRPFSTAFERLVRGDGADDDIVGLLAYALYKKDKRELALSGALDAEHLRNHHKTLTAGLVGQYRESALRQLEGYSADVVLSARPEIEEAARISAVEQARDAVVEAIRSSTDWKMSIMWNVVAWLISLAITFLVAFSGGYLKLNFPVQ